MNDDLNVRLARLGAEPAPFIDTAIGLWCSLHSAYDCAEPFCWRCGNHEMDERSRCADPRCRSTNTPEVIALVGELGRDSSIEVLTYAIGRMLSGDRYRVVRDGSVPGGLVAASPAPSLGDER